jgi:hypothetical protein
MTTSKFHYLVTVKLKRHSGKIAAKGELALILGEILEEALTPTDLVGLGDAAGTAYEVESFEVAAVPKDKARWLSDNPPKVPRTVRVRSEPDPEPEHATNGNGNGNGNGKANGMTDRLADLLPRGSYRAVTTFEDER